MDLIISFVITAIVTAIALIIISKLPLGVEVDSVGKALISGLVFGVLGALVHPIRALLELGPLEYLFFPLLFLLNVAVFGLTAKLVEGFRLRSIWSAVFGSLLLTVVASVLSTVFSKIFTVVV